MLKNFWNDILLLNLNEFENIGFDFYINMFLLALGIGICIFSVGLELSRGAMFTMMKQLIRHQATSEEIVGENVTVRQDRS